MPVDALFILLEGKLAVWLRRRRGPERELARLNAGEIVGEMSFVDARPPSATVKALEDSTVFALSKAVLTAKLAADSGFAARFYRALAIYLSTTVRERHRDLGPGAPGRRGGGGRRRAGPQRARRRLPGGGAVRPDGEAGHGLVGEQGLAAFNLKQS